MTQSRRQILPHFLYFIFVSSGYLFCLIFETQKYVFISQGAAGFPGGRGLPGPPGSNVSTL